MTYAPNASCGVTHARRARAGVTLVEVMIATLLIGVTIVAALETVRGAAYAHRLSASRSLGPALAHDLMSEIVSTPYEDPEDGAGPIGVDTGELTSTRADFDDVDDYDGWDSANAQAKDGAAIADFAGWRRQAAVEWANRTDGSVELLSDTGLKRVTVTVTGPDGAQTVLEALRWKDGALEQPPEADTNAVTWVGAELRIGDSPTAVRRGTHVTNHASDAN